MATLPVLVHSGMICTGILSMCSVLMGAGWQYQTAQLVTLFLTGLEVIQTEIYITKINWNWGYNQRQMLRAIQCFGILTTNSSLSMAVDGELKDSVTALPMRSGTMGMFQVIYQTRETVFHRDIQTLRRKLKMRRAAEYFWRNSRCLDSRWNTVSSVWYIFSSETKTKE